MPVDKWDKYAAPAADKWDSYAQTPEAPVEFHMPDTSGKRLANGFIEQGRVAPQESDKPFSQRAIESLTSLVSSPIHAAIAPPKTKAEENIHKYIIPGASHAVMAAKRMIVDPAVNEWNEAGKTTGAESLAHRGASLIPFAGSSAVQAGHDIANHDYRGAAIDIIGAMAGAHGTAPALEGGMRFAAEHTPKPFEGSLAPRMMEPIAPGETLTRGDVVSAAKNRGVNLDVATATGSPVAGALKKGNQYSIGGHVIGERAGKANVEALGKWADSTLNEAHPTPATPELTGQAVKQALTEHQKGLQTRSGEIFNELTDRNGVVQPDLAAIREAAQRVVAENADYYEKNPQLMPKRAWAIVNDLANRGNVKPAPAITIRPEGFETFNPDTATAAKPAPIPDTWSDLHKMRSDLMNEYRSPDIAGSRAEGWLKQLVGATDETMTGNASRLSPADLELFRQGNELYSQMKETYDNTSHPFYHAVRGPYDQAAINLPHNQTPGVATDLLNAMGEGNSGIIRRQVVQNLLQGVSKDGVPDFKGLDTRVGRVNPDYLRTVLGELGASDLQTMGKVGDMVARDHNPSATAKSVVPAGEISLALHNPLAGGAVIGGNFGLAKLLNSPKVLDYLTRAKESKPVIAPPFAEGPTSPLPPVTLNEGPKVSPPRGTTGAEFLADLKRKQAYSQSMPEALRDLESTYGLTESHLRSVADKSGVRLMNVEDTSLARNGLLIRVDDPQTGSTLNIRVKDAIDDFPAALDKAREGYKSQQVQPAAPLASEPLPAIETYGSKNKIVSSEDAMAATKSLRDKLGRSHSGIPLDALPELAKVGAYHLEAGLREFGTWSQKMVEEFGETIQPYLDNIWQQANKNDKSLVAYHNTNANGILASAKLGGIPAPSLAVLGKDMPFDSFGDITLVGNREMIDPTVNPQNKLYAADAYSPRQPRESFKFSSAGIGKLEAYLGKAQNELRGSKYGYDVNSTDWYGRGKSVEMGRLVDKLSTDPAVQLTYLRERGVDVPMQAVEPGKFGYDYENNEAVRTAMENVDKSDFSAYVEKLADSVTEGHPFFEQGSKKKPYVLDELVSSMTGKGIRAQEGGPFKSLGGARAASIKAFKDIEGLRKNRPTLATKEEFKQYKEATDTKFFEFSNEITEHHQASNPFDRIDAASEVLRDYMKGAATEQNMRYALSRNGFKVDALTPEAISKGMEAAKLLRNAPTEYFEAKLKRAVGLHEFSGAVVPESTPQAVIDVLEKQGVNVIKYKGHADRLTKVKELQNKPGVLFAGAESGTKPTVKLPSIKLKK